jgi:hypothetical protein
LKGESYDETLFRRLTFPNTSTVCMLWSRYGAQTFASDTANRRPPALPHRRRVTTTCLHPIRSLTCKTVRATLPQLQPGCMY